MKSRLYTVESGYAIWYLPQKRGTRCAEKLNDGDMFVESVELMDPKNLISKLDYEEGMIRRLHLKVIAVDYVLRFYFTYPP